MGLLEPWEVVLPTLEPWLEQLVLVEPTAHLGHGVRIYHVLFPHMLVLPASLLEGLYAADHWALKGLLSCVDTDVVLQRMP